MRKTCLTTILAAVLALPAHADERPLLPVFKSVDEIQATCDAGMKATQAAIDSFAIEKSTSADGKDVLNRWDALIIQLEEFAGPMDITAAVAIDGGLRDAADACNVRIAQLANGLFQNAGIYAQIRRLGKLSGADAELRQVLIEGFEDAGVALPEAKRQRAREILDRLAVLAVDFQKNAREKRSTITLNADELRGLPAAYLDRHKADADGRYTLTMDYTDYFPFMENAESGDARRRYFVTFNQIGGDENLAFMAEAFQLRKELAGLFGKPSYADYALQHKMAGTPTRVLDFLRNVKGKVNEVEASELAILRQEKARQLGTDPAQTRIEKWDVSYYLERVRKQRYTVDQEALRRYFPTDVSVAWMFDLAHRLYGVRFVQTAVPTWHEDVRYYDVIDERGRRIAGAYFDLYPRAGKYSHAAVWPVRHGSTRINRTPISVMVANLDRKGLNHNELETLLHEFGHMLHGTLSRAHYATLSGTNVRQDFVEAPSQMFEEWARRLQPLALMRDHCSDCPVVDAALLARLNEARRFGAGIRYARQHMLASFDMQLSGPQPGDPLAVWTKLEEESALGHVPDTRFPAQFGHLLGGYAAGYYGYMWSEVLALDIAAQWKNHPLDGKIGRRYLDTILSRGGEVPPQEMVRKFLGREPSPAAFFAEITGKSR